MKNQTDNTKKILEDILAELYKKQKVSDPSSTGNYLIAQDGQFLGNITNNLYDPNSILNPYGSFGSRYSTTSIFNPYSQYGSRYGTYSIFNPYSSLPPKLILNGQLAGFVTENSFIRPRIPAKSFLYTLHNDLNLLLQGKFIESEIEARQMRGESFIAAADGTFLGSLDRNVFNSESIFNKVGRYGNQFSPASIFNQYGSYGSQFSQYSPYNPNSSNPPRIYIKGVLTGYLTKNENHPYNVDPDKFEEWVDSKI